MYILFLLLLAASVVLSPFAFDLWLRRDHGRQDSCSARRRFNAAAARRPHRHQTWAAPQLS